MHPLYHLYVYSKHLFPPCGLHFHSLNVIFHIHKSLIYNIVLFIIFMYECFIQLFKKSSFTQHILTYSDSQASKQLERNLDFKFLIVVMLYPEHEQKIKWRHV